MPQIPLSGSVGNGGRNEPEDVRRVRRRFRELGYDWLDDSTVANSDLSRVIRLFQSIKNGLSNLSGDGRIDVGLDTHQWLQARNAPRWLAVRESPGDVGWRKFIDGDRHDFGTDWLRDAISAAGVGYAAAHLSANPNDALIEVNDVSLPRGGNTPDHAGHETGLMCDLRLPHRDGSSGGITWRDSEYDQSATRAMLRAFRAQPASLRFILFNDPTLIAEGLCQREDDHDNHIHVEIVVPARQPA